MLFIVVLGDGEIDEHAETDDGKMRPHFACCSHHIAIIASSVQLVENSEN